MDTSPQINVKISESDSMFVAPHHVLEFVSLEKL